MSLLHRLSKLENKASRTTGQDIVIVRTIVAPSGASHPAYGRVIGHAGHIHASAGETHEEFSARCDRHLEQLKSIPQEKAKDN